MEREEAVKTVRAIWAAKAEADSFKHRPSHLQDFLNAYLFKKHGKPAAVAEVIYSLAFSCSIHSFEPELRVFIKVRNDSLLVMRASVSWRYDNLTLSLQADLPLSWN